MKRIKMAGRFLTFLSMVALIVISCNMVNKKFECKYFRGTVPVDMKLSALSKVCDSLTILNKTDTLLFFFFIKDLADLNKIKEGPVLLNSRSGAVIFIEAGSKKHDIYFSKSLKNPELLNNRFAFSKSIYNALKKDINETFFYEIMDEFKKTFPAGAGK